jgi:DHA1 family tetracycline resistance protein-like MFS transporter
VREWPQMKPSSSQTNQSSTQRKTGRSPLLVIFLTVFIDLVGFGIIIPLSPYLAREFQATPTQIGLLLSIYSIMQFLFSPVWGGLSDRFGRRPILLVSILGGALSYLLFAFSSGFWILFAARGLAGLFGGNISTAHAYIADVTKPEERSKGMGLIGAAFGLGFIVGPIMGGLLGILGQRLGSAPPFGLSFSALGAAILCLVNFVFAYTTLKESLPPEKRASSVVRRRRLFEIWRQLRRPVVGPLVFVYFLSGLAMAQMEAMLFPYVDDVFQWDIQKASYGFAYVGVLMVLTQGYFIRKWMPKYGEPAILATGLALFSISLFGIGFSTTVTLMAITMTILALGNGLMRPPNLGLISLLTPAEEQGAAMGVTNSTASLGRIVGPIIGGYLYQNMSKQAPFILAGLLSLIAFVMILASYRRLPTSGKAKGPAHV